MPYMQLLYTCTDQHSPLVNRTVAVTTHMLPQIKQIRLQPMFRAFGTVYHCDDFAMSDAEMLQACRDARVDALFVMEYANHSSVRRRLFRNAGINYWHMGLGVIDHYATSRFDWGLYDDDTYLRWMTSPDRIICPDAELLDDPVRYVLVVGQVQGDQALMHGGLGFNSLQLVSDVREILPAARIRYRPHPKTLERVRYHKLKSDTVWYPDPFLQNPLDGVDVSKRVPLANDLEWADAVVTINSTTAYEAIQAGKPVYNAGIPTFHEHPGGNMTLDYLDQGKRVISPEYQRGLKVACGAIQSAKYSKYEAELWIEQERRMLIEMGERGTVTNAPVIQPPTNVFGKHLGDLSQFKRDFKPSSQILIVGSGPSALYIDKVTLDNYTVIAVNAACGLVNPDLLMIMNIDAWKFPRIWSELSGKWHLIGDKLLEQAGGYPHPHYSFQHLAPGIGGKFDPWVLDGAGGIASRAIQLAASYPHVKVIHMIGLDYCNETAHYYDCVKAPKGIAEKPYSVMAKGMRNTIRTLMSRIEFGHYGPSALCRVEPSIKQLLPEMCK